jgi:hypothetical protein
MICYPHYLLASPKKFGVHNSTLEYVSTANISTTPHLHNHGLAMLACITPLRIIRPPLIYQIYLKRSFWISDFLLKYHQNPKSLRDGAKNGRERKVPRVSSNKGKINILRWDRHFNFKTPFQCDPIFSLSIIPFQKKNLSKIIEKVFLTHFGPSFHLAIYMTWVVPFLLTNELHIFSL